MRKLIAIIGLAAALAALLATTAFGHTLGRDVAAKQATAYAQAIIDDPENEWGVYEYELGRCRTVTAHRRDCEVTFHYADEMDHSDGACDVTVTVRYATARSQRVTVYDRGDWDCDPDA